MLSPNLPNNLSCALWVVLLFLTKRQLSVGQRGVGLCRRAIASNIPLSAQRGSGFLNACFAYPCPALALPSTGHVSRAECANRGTLQHKPGLLEANPAYPSSVFASPASGHFFCAEYANPRGLQRGYSILKAGGRRRGCAYLKARQMPEHLLGLGFHACLLAQRCRKAQAGHGFNEVSFHFGCLCSVKQLAKVVQENLRRKKQNAPGAC